jgi:glycosyltransferase involved in cell wall biosynthesis
MGYGLSGESVVCFAGEDWWYHHPHSKNHILKRWARDNRVLFINSLSLGLPSLSNPDFFVKIRRKLKSYLRWLKKTPEGLHVMSPISIPLFGSATVRKINFFLLIAQVRLAMLLCGIHRPILWVAIPSAADVANRLGAKIILYHVSDKYDANEDSSLSRDVIRAWDSKLKSMAAMVMFSGRKLFAESDLPRRYFLEQAVDFDHFSTEASETAPEIAAIPRPVLGYMGALDFIMDVPLIEAVAAERPDWHWVFIGLRSNHLQVSAPNVHFLGSKKYADLPKYLRHVDVCVLPWRRDNEFIQYGSAIKVREYLATGKPVVISPIYEYLNTPGVRIYRTVNEFISVVEDALNRDTLAQRKLRQSVVRDCTWDIRARQLGDMISSLLRGTTFAEAVGASKVVTPPEEELVPHSQAVN